MFWGSPNRAHGSSESDGSDSDVERGLFGRARAPVKKTKPPSNARATWLGRLFTSAPGAAAKRPKRERRSSKSRPRSCRPRTSQGWGILFLSILLFAYLVDFFKILKSPAKAYRHSLSSRSAANNASVSLDANVTSVGNASLSTSSNISSVSTTNRLAEPAVHDTSLGAANKTSGASSASPSEPLQNGNSDSSSTGSANTSIVDRVAQSITQEANQATFSIGSNPPSVPVVQPGAYTPGSLSSSSVGSVGLPDASQSNYAASSLSSVANTASAASAPAPASSLSFPTSSSGTPALAPPSAFAPAAVPNPGTPSVASTAQDSGISAALSSAASSGVSSLIASSASNPSSGMAPFNPSGASVGTPAGAPVSAGSVVMGAPTPPLSLNARLDTGGPPMPPLPAAFRAPAPAASAAAPASGAGLGALGQAQVPATTEITKHPMNRNMPELQVPGNSGVMPIETVKEYYRRLAQSYLATFKNGIYRQLYFDVLRRRTYALTPPGANKGVQSLLFQIIDRKVYLMDPYEVPRNSKPFYRTRINEVIWLLSRLATEGRIKNTEFLMSIHDCVQTVNKPHTYRGAHFTESNPSFTIVSCNFSDNIPFPMWEGTRSRDSGFSGWDSMVKDYAQDVTPWESKVSKAVFRGGNRPSMYFKNKADAENHCADVGRTRLLHLSEQQPDLLDVSIGGSCGGKRSRLTRLEPKEHHKFKYIMYAEGNCMWADRIRQQIFGPSAIIKQETPCGQFFEPLLKPGTHYIPTDFFFSDTVDKVRWARDNEPEVRGIVRNANEFAQNFLTLKGIETYVEVLLHEYTALRVEADVKLENGATDVTFKSV